MLQTKSSKSKGFSVEKKEEKTIVLKKVTQNDYERKKEALNIIAAEERKEEFKSIMEMRKKLHTHLNSDHTQEKLDESEIERVNSEVETDRIKIEKKKIDRKSLLIEDEGFQEAFEMNEEKANIAISASSMEMVNSLRVEQATEQNEYKSQNQSPSSGFELATKKKDLRESPFIEGRRSEKVNSSLREINARLQENETKKKLVSRDLEIKNESPAYNFRKLLN